jgi:biopolymer transport protein ExbD
MSLRSPGSDELMIEINTTPLIDVLLVLLIMLIITIPPATHAVKLDLPTDNPPASRVEPQIVRLVIDFDGTISWNGTVLADRAALEEQLRAGARQDPQPEIHIAPDERVKYAYVAMVLAESQRLGVTRIGIVAGEQLME